MIQPVETDIAYAAAIVDGEGCISIGRQNRAARTPHYQLAVIVAMTDRPVIDWLYSRFGGHISDKVWSSLQTRQQWRWTVTDHKADVFLTTIYPYLKAKQKQADVAFFLRDGYSARGGQNPAPRELVGLREAIYRRMKSIKREPASQ